MKENRVDIAINDGVHLRVLEVEFEVFGITADKDLGKCVCVWGGREREREKGREGGRVRRREEERGERREANKTEV